MLPVLIMAVLVVAGVFCAFSKNKSFAKTLTLAALLAAIVLSVITLRTVLVTGNPIAFSAGVEPWNISVSVGTLEAFMAVIFSVIGFLIIWASVFMIEHDVATDKVPLYYALINWLLATLCGVVFFNNLFNVFVFIELSSFAAAGIVIIKNEAQNLRAGLKYLSLSILGSSLVLMGMVILYSVSGGHLVMGALHTALATAFAGNEQPVLFAAIFITLGVSFKSALFPFHIWLPDAHGTAPSPSSAVLSSLVLKAYIIFYIKVLYVVLGYDIINSPFIRPLLTAVLIVGTIAMLAGSILAILQNDIKRMIAYSSVAQIGYIFMGIGLGNKLGLTAAVFHILAHAVTKSGLFLIAGTIIEQTHNRKLDEMGGLGYRMPVTMAMFTVGALSMVGIPLFVGFNSKWNFASAIMDSGQFWVMIVLSVSSLLNALYYLPIVVRAFFGPDAVKIKADKKAYPSQERTIKELAPILILSVLVIVTAVASTPITEVILNGINGFSIMLHQPTIRRESSV